MKKGTDACSLSPLGKKMCLLIKRLLLLGSEAVGLAGCAVICCDSVDRTDRAAGANPRAPAGTREGSD